MTARNDNDWPSSKFTKTIYSSNKQMEMEMLQKRAKTSQRPARNKVVNHTNLQQPPPPQVNKLLFEISKGNNKMKNLFEGGGSEAQSSSDDLCTKNHQSSLTVPFRRPGKFPLKYVKNLARVNLINYCKCVAHKHKNLQQIKNNKSKEKTIILKDNKSAHNFIRKMDQN